MSEATWKTQNDLCRCCHAEGSFVSLTDPVFNLGTTEVYMDILKSCLNVELIPIMEISHAMRICEVCIGRLREANHFRKQVLSCEDRFKEVYKEFIKNIPIKKERTFEHEVKVEYGAPTDVDSYSAKFDDSDDDQPIIKIKVEEKKPPRKRLGRPPKDPNKPRKPPKPKPDGPEAAALRETRKKENETALQACIETSVNGEKHYQCDGCSKTFKRKSHCAEHYKHAHLRFGTHFTLTKSEDGTDEYVYTCNTCGKSWKKFMYFRQHFKNVHEKVLAGKCDICNIKLPSVKRAKHMEEVHNVPRPQCNICNKKFAFPSMVLRHQKVVHMGEANFECPTCFKRFPTLDRWKRHQIVHSTIREDTCTHCGKSFKWKKSLEAHMRIHLEDRRYACEICGEAFVHGTSLRYHRNKKHPNFMFFADADRSSFMGESSCNSLEMKDHLEPKSMVSTEYGSMDAKDHLEIEPKSMVSTEYDPAETVLSPECSISVCASPNSRDHDQQDGKYRE